MNINAFLRYGIVFLSLNLCVIRAQEDVSEDEASYRESLYMSEIDRDLRTPQAVRVGGVVFIGAMTAPGESLEQQMKTIYIRIQSALGNFGLSMGNVAQERVYLVDGDDFDAVSRLRVSYYREDTAPAVSMLEVQGLPAEGARIAIEVMAVFDPYEE